MDSFFGLLVKILHNSACFDGAVTNQTMFLLDSSAEGNFFSDTCTDGVGQLDFHNVLSLK